MLTLFNTKDSGKIMKIIINEQPLSQNNEDHQLSGEWKGRRECHIEPDWLLIYRIEQELKKVFFERTGTHSDLFSKY